MSCLGGAVGNNLEDEQAALVKGFLPVAEQFFQLQSLSDASSEVWNGLMWEVLQVGVAKTQSAQLSIHDGGRK